MTVSRFAPSTTGFAHPGTLLAALLCWLDARTSGARLVLRLEDLDVDRSRSEYREAMIRDLEWLGLDFDHVQRQSECRAQHEAALDLLQAKGRLYPCTCSRSQIRTAGLRASGGGFRYPGTCRARSLGAGGWRASEASIRLRLDAGRIELHDASGDDLGQDPLTAFGDPIVRRRDGAMAYHLASVVDDAALGVDRIVRGRDLADSTATQVALQRLLGLATPSYRHHLLLLERRGEKLAKLHGSVGTPELREHLSAEALCGVLAHACGLAAQSMPVQAAALLEGFDWSRIRRADRLLGGDGQHLSVDSSP